MPLAHFSTASRNDLLTKTPEVIIKEVDKSEEPKTEDTK